MKTITNIELKHHGIPMPVLLKAIAELTSGKEEYKANTFLKEELKIAMCGYTVLATPKKKFTYFKLVLVSEVEADTHSSWLHRVIERLDNNQRALLSMSSLPVEVQATEEEMASFPGYQSLIMNEVSYTADIHRGKIQIIRYHLRKSVPDLEAKINSLTSEIRELKEKATSVAASSHALAAFSGKNILVSMLLSEAHGTENSVRGGSEGSELVTVLAALSNDRGFTVGEVRVYNKVLSVFHNDENEFEVSCGHVTVYLRDIASKHSPMWKRIVKDLLAQAVHTSNPVELLKAIDGNEFHRSCYLKRLSDAYSENDLCASFGIGESGKICHCLTKMERRYDSMRERVLSSSVEEAEDLIVLGIASSYDNDRLSNLLDR